MYLAMLEAYITWKPLPHTDNCSIRKSSGQSSCQPNELRTWIIIKIKNNSIINIVTN